MAAVISVVESSSPDGRVHKIQWTWVSAADGTGSLPSVKSYFGEVLALLTDPGSPAPTDNYGITITDADGYDVMQAASTANRDTANTETVVPTAKSVAFGILTLNLSGAGNAKAGVATLYILGHRAPA